MDAISIKESLIENASNLKRDTILEEVYEQIIY